MEKEIIAERVRTIYQKDLYDPNLTLNVRLESDQFTHGDNLRITVERLQEAPDRDSEDESDETLQEESSDSDQ